MITERKSGEILITDKTDIKTNHITWGDYFMSIAILSSLRSKDPNTKVGAAIVSKEHKVLSLGYNGMPTGIDEEKLSWRNEANEELDTKYLYVCHAELNAIINANKDLRGSIIYTTLFPCNECTKALIQAGIGHIIYLSDKYHDEKNAIAARKLLDLAHVTYEEYDGKIPHIDFDNIKYVSA